jgi:hypothetical protein
MGNVFFSESSKNQRLGPGFSYKQNVDITCFDTIDELNNIISDCDEIRIGDQHELFSSSACVVKKRDGQQYIRYCDAVDDYLEYCTKYNPNNKSVINIIFCFTNYVSINGQLEEPRMEIRINDQDKHRIGKTVAQWCKCHDCGIFIKNKNFVNFQQQWDICDVPDGLLGVYKSDSFCCECGTPERMKEFKQTDDIPPWNKK